MRVLFLLGESKSQLFIEIGFWFVVLLALLFGAYLLIQYIRKENEESCAPSSEILTQFRDMHASGEISEEEYRNIKGRLAEKIQHELNKGETSG